MYREMHADASVADLREVLMEIYQRIPARALRDAHEEAVRKGNYIVLKEAGSEIASNRQWQLPSGELQKNIPFVSVVMQQLDGSLVRSWVEPDDVAGYGEDVRHAVWIYFTAQRS
ncbi:MAG: hypothetical protein AAF368_17760 [Planctomycetota bacterium]